MPEFGLPFNGIDDPQFCCWKEINIQFARNLDSHGTGD
jgi:hypothetical protein